MHLGDISKLTLAQIWETLSKKGVHSGIWGVMNGGRRSASNCDFFTCDPWTFGDKPYPPDLGGLTRFAQYIAKNYLNLSASKLIGHATEYFFALLRFLPISDLCAATGLLLNGLLRFGPSNAVLGAFYEYTAATAFVNQRKRYRPQLSIFFFNLIAHMQHHYWTSANELSRELSYGFKTLDCILGMLFNSLQNLDVLLVVNALSQQNTNSESPWILYRPKDHSGMLKSLDLDFTSVEALMTMDADVFFATQEQRDRAARLMKSASILNSPLFYVEADPKNPRKLFYRLQFSDPVSEDTEFHFDDKSRRFQDHFKKVVLRTGRHCQDGFVYQTKRIMPEYLENHLIHDYICNYLGVEVSTNPSSSQIGAHL